MRVRSGSARLVRWIVIPLTMLALVTQAAPSASAEGNDLLNQYNQAQDKLKWIQDQKAKADNDFEKANLDYLAAKAQSDKAAADAAAANAQLNLINGQYAAAQNSLVKVQADLTKAQQGYDEKKAALGRRIRSINEDGRVSYLEVLFGAATFSDFINRFEALKMVVKQDAALFDQVRADRKDLETKQAAALKNKADLEVLRAQAVERKNAAEATKVQQDQATRTLEMSRRALAARQDALDQQEQAARDEIDQLLLSMKTPAGSFSPLWPIHGRIIITDPYGPRIHPILGDLRMHYGVDIGADLGQPVYAVESGTVIQAGWNDAYGNLVVIDHGGGNSSWYGHASKLLVHVGDKVVRGQQITEAGSTGWSTGPHVHLEIHIAGKPVDPTSLLPKL